MSQKIGPGGSKTSFAPNFTIFITFEVCINFYDSGPIFENLDLWVKNFQKSQKTSFFNICCFLGKVG